MTLSSGAAISTYLTDDDSAPELKVFTLISSRPDKDSAPRISDVAAAKKKIMSGRDVHHAAAHDLLFAAATSVHPRRAVRGRVHQVEGESA